MKAVLSAATLVVAAATTTDANAAGFAAAYFGGEHGNVTTTNPTALYYNPAGIAFGGARLFAEGTLALRGISFQHAQAPSDMPDPAGAEGASFGRGALSNVFGGPTLGATAPFGNLALGASLSVPFGGRAHWQKNERFRTDPNFPGAVDGVQRWHQIDGAITFIYLTAGAAYKLGRVSFGVTGNLINGSVKNLQAKNPTGTGDGDLAREGRAYLDVSGWLGSFGLGAMAEVVEHTLWLGVSYQAQPGLGPMKLKGTLAQSYQGQTRPFPVEFSQALPDVVRAGLRWSASPALELRLSGTYMRWSVLQTQCLALEGHECAVDSTGADATPDASVLQNLRRYWDDTYAVRGGGSVWVTPGLELFAGVGYETAAIPDRTMEPSLTDANNISGALGATLAVGGGFSLTGSYTHLYHFDRDTTGKSQLAMAESPTRRQDSGGKYTLWIGLFNLSVEKQF
jgi:long-chain fatty acid transport protein